MALIVDNQEGIAIITLNRPEALNALDNETRRELTELWDEMNQDDEVKVAVITGSGRAFCSGLDMKEAAQRVRVEGETGVGTGGQGFAFLPMKMNKPLIAAVNGAAAGGGLGLALFSDIAICSEEAFFVASYVSRGIMDSSVMAQLMKKATPGWAMWMALSGQRVDAQTALRIGLVNEVLTKDQLLPRSLDMAETIRRNSSITVLAIKEKMKNTLEKSYQEAMDLIGSYEEVFRKASISQEGIVAFTEKRRPQFT